MDNGLQKLENEFCSILSELNEINNENFESKFNRIRFLQDMVEKDRAILLAQFDHKKLQGHNQRFDILIKQITKKFDDMILVNRSRQKEISNKLNRLLNHKKLVNYQR